MTDELSAEGKAVVVMMATVDLQQALVLFTEHAAQLADKLQRFAETLAAVGALQTVGRKVPESENVPLSVDPDDLPLY